MFCISRSNWCALHCPMDTPESLAIVNDSIVALRSVHEHFPTNQVQNTVLVAENLVRMCQKKKLDAAETLGRSAGHISNDTHYLNVTCFIQSRATKLHASAVEDPATVPRNEVDLRTVPNGTDLSRIGLDLFDWEGFLESDLFYL